MLDCNARVVKLHLKFGSMAEGIFRAHHKMNDAFVDVHRLGIFASEWAQKRSELLEKMTRLIRS